jgi:hypothetical protein
MSRWHRENPEHYEQFGEPDWLGAADLERKRQKEEGPIRQLSPDRAALIHDDREMCPCCGELPAQDVYCVRCARSIEEDKLERESNR